MKEYHPLPGFPTDMPYFCLRVPTGGGKTWLAAKSVTRAMLDTSTTIIIATRQAFQVNDIMPWACGYGSTRRSWCLGLR